MKVSIVELFDTIDRNLPKVYSMMTGSEDELKLAIDFKFDRLIVFRRDVDQVEIWLTSYIGEEIRVGSVPLYQPQPRYNLVFNTGKAVCAFKLALCRHLMVPYMEHLRSNSDLEKFFMECLEKNSIALYGSGDRETVNNNISNIVSRWTTSLMSDDVQQAIPFNIT